MILPLHHAQNVCFVYKLCCYLKAFCLLDRQDFDMQKAAQPIWVRT